MIVEQELKKLFQDLTTNDHAQIFFCGSDISVRLYESATKLLFTTPVYFGGDYIPQSVRKGIAKTPPFEKNQTLKTFLTVDEENFRVFLNYLGATETLNGLKFSQLLEDFSYLAEEWKIYLDEHDQNDLIYVHAQ